MQRFVFSCVFIIILGCSAISLTGCTTTKNVYQKVRLNRNDLTKRVLILPFIDEAEFGKEEMDRLQQNFATLLKEKGKLLVEVADLATPVTLARLTDSTETDLNPQLLKIADDRSADVLISAIFHPLEIDVRKIGSWPLVITRRELDFSMTVIAINVPNKTLFLNKQVDKRLKMEEKLEEFTLFEDVLEEEKPEEIEDPLSYVEKKDVLWAQSKILKSEASAIIDELNDEPWSGKILSVEGRTILINAGADLGLKPGTVFDVFGQGESIESESGRFFHLLGPKIGEIKTVQIMEKRSEAVPLTETTFDSGLLIRLKKGD